MVWREGTGGGRELLDLCTVWGALSPCDASSCYMRFMCLRDIL